MSRCIDWAIPAHKYSFVLSHNRYKNLSLILKSDLETRTWFFAAAVLMLHQETQLVVSKQKVEKMKCKETLLYGERKSIYLLEISHHSPARPSGRSGMKLKM